MGVNIPAHKVVGDAHKPGQIKTISDYVAVVEGFEYPHKAKKLTFDEWVDLMSKEFGNYSCYASYEGSCISLMEIAWKAAQENM